jgi:DNA repair protein RadC
MILYKSNIERIKLKKEKSNTIPKAQLKSSKDAETYCRWFYDDDIEVIESFWIILLNRANNTIGYAQISQGGTASCTVDVKIIAKKAIDCLASGVIVCHNHPSGNLNPSDADKNITKRIKEVLKFLDIALLDHVILTNDSYFSFNDNGIL